MEVQWNKFDDNNDSYVDKEEFMSNEGMSEMLKKMMQLMNEHMIQWVNTYKRKAERKAAEKLMLYANYGLFLKLYDKKDGRVSREEYFKVMKEEKIWIFKNLPQHGRQYDKKFNETFVDFWNQFDHNPKDDYLEKEEFFASDYTNIDTALTTYLQLDENDKLDDDNGKTCLNFLMRRMKRYHKKNI